MKAARLYGPSDLRVEVVADPTPAAGEAVVKVLASGVCPSDIRSYTAATTSSKGPWTPGHEVAGVVVACGDAVANVVVGDRVVLDWRGVCGHCFQCRRGAANFCEHLVKLPIAGFAELTVMPAQQLHPIAADLTFEAASFCEPLACVVNAHRQMPVALTTDLVVVGAGPIGLLHTQVALRRGARVIVADMNAERLEVAKALGAHDTVDVSAGDPVAAVKALTRGRGADTVVVTVGAPPVIQGAFAYAAVNGTVNLFAGTHPKADVALDPAIPHYDQISITGSHDFIPNDFATALRLLELGMVDVAPLISHRFTLDRIVDAFETTKNQVGLKSVIVDSL